MARTHGRAVRAANVAYCALVLAFLVLPLLAIVPLSFNGGTFLTYPLQGLSLRWYAEVFTSEDWGRAAWNSVVVGCGATALALALGVPAAIGLWLSRIPGRGLLLGLLIAPMIVPVIITAVGVFFFFAHIGLANSRLGIILAHAVLAAPFVVIAVSASLQGFDRNLLRAAASLGATPATAFRKVMLPILSPGILTGGLFAFAVSLDEVVVVIFLSGPAQRTLPREMFDGLRENISPAILAVAALFVVLASLLMVAAEMLRHRGEMRRTGR